MEIGLNPTAENSIKNKQILLPAKTPAALPNAVSYTDSKESSRAITNNAVTAHLKKPFIPAKTPQELIKQLNALTLCKPNESEINSIIRQINPDDIVSFSNILNRLQGLKPEILEKTKISALAQIFKGTYGNLLAPKESLANVLPIKEINGLNEQALNALKELRTSYLSNVLLQTGIPDLEGVNQLAQKANPEVLQKTAISPFFFSFTKENRPALLKKMEILNGINPADFEKYPVTKILFSPKDPAILKNTVAYIAEHEAKSGQKLNSILIDRFIENDYSLSINANLKNNTLDLGTPNFKPYTLKSQLQDALSAQRTPDGLILFSNEEILKIVGSENDIGEMSKILNELKKNKINLSSYNLSHILNTEGVTAQMIAPNIEFTNQIKNNPHFKTIKDLCFSAENFNDIFENNNIDLKKITKNLSLIDVLKKYNPELLDKNNMSIQNNILNILNNSKVEGPIFEKLMSAGLYENLELYDVSKILENPALNRPNIENNIKALQSMKKSPKLDFLFKESSFNDGLSYHNLTSLLAQEIPENFDIKNKGELVDFVETIYKDPKYKKFIGGTNKTYVDILLNCEGSAKEGVELIETLMKFGDANCNSYNVFTKGSFNENKEILLRASRNPMINGKMAEFPFYFANNNQKELVKALDIAEYAASKPNLKKNIIDFEYLTAVLKESPELSDANILSIENFKKDLDKLEEFASKLSPKLNEKIGNELLSQTLLKKNGRDSILSGNLNLMEKLLKNNEFDEIFKNFNDQEILRFLSKDNVNLKAVEKNSAAFIEYCKKFGDPHSGIEHNLFNILEYEGDTNALIKEAEEFKAQLPAGKTFVIDVDPETKKIFFKSQEGQILRFDKNMALTEKELVKELHDKSGNVIRKRTIEDIKNRTMHKITECTDATYNIWTPEEQITSYFDESGKTIKTRITKKSNVDGAFNIKELTPDGKIKTVSSAFENSEGTFIRKELESIDGTKSSINYKRTNAGHEYHEYKITDKTGKSLLNQTRTTEIIDPNTVINTVNDKKYKVRFAQDILEVFDVQSKTKTKIDLKILNPKQDKVLADMLRTMSGDELLKMNKYVKELELTERLGSAIDTISKKMYIGPHKFIFEHELGHGKDESKILIEDLKKCNNIEELNKLMKSGDSLLSSDPSVVKIFENEKALFKNKMSRCMHEFANYFVDEATHYNGKLGGLRELIAESNAIQTTPRFHPLLQMRSQLVQEYFPKTLSLLIKHKF